MINRLHMLAELVLKELKQLFCSVGAVLTLLEPCVLELFVLAYTSTMDLKDCPFAVLDRECTAETRAIAAKFERANVFTRQADFVDEDDIRRRLVSKDVKMAVVFPTNFTRSRTLQLIADGRNTVSAGSAFGYASKIVMAQNAENNNIYAHEGMIRERAWFNPNYDAEWFQIPSLLVSLTLLSLAMVIALSLAKEKEMGTLDQLRLTPFTAFETLLAKGISGVILGVMQLAIALLLTFGWFEIPFTGAPLALVIMVFAFLISAVGLGLLASAFSSTLQQATILTFIISTPLTMLSGMSTPIACMPDWLQVISKGNPITWAIVALQRIFLEGGGVSEVIFPAGILVLIGVICFGIAWSKFRLK